MLVLEIITNLFRDISPSILVNVQVEAEQDESEKKKKRESELNAILSTESSQKQQMK